VAIKTYLPTKFDNALYEILNNCRLYEYHPNVVGLRAVEFLPDEKKGYIKRIRLMFEKVKGDNLKKFVSGVNAPLKKLSLKEKRIIQIELFRQIVDGVKSIHRAGVIHSDLKPVNVMIEDLGNNKFKANIIDMGSGI
jgi:serine/threonine protein kinase